MDDLVRWVDKSALGVRISECATFYKGAENDALSLAAENRRVYAVDGVLFPRCAEYDLCVDSDIRELWRSFDGAGTGFLFTSGSLNDELLLSHGLRPTRQAEAVSVGAVGAGTGPKKRSGGKKRGATASSGAGAGVGRKRVAGSGGGGGGVMGELSRRRVATQRKHASLRLPLPRESVTTALAASAPVLKRRRTKGCGFSASSAQVYGKKGGLFVEHGNKTEVCVYFFFCSKSVFWGGEFIYWLGLAHSYSTLLAFLLDCSCCSNVGICGSVCTGMSANFSRGTWRAWGMAT